MRIPILRRQLKRDILRLQKRGSSRKKFEDTIGLLLKNGSLPKKYKVHKLKGIWQGKWECHIESDWLLIYTVEKQSITIYRTGTHSELF